MHCTRKEQNKNPYHWNFVDSLLIEAEPYDQQVSLECLCYPSLAVNHYILMKNLKPVEFMVMMMERVTELVLRCVKVVSLGRFIDYTSVVFLGLMFLSS